MPHSIHQSMTFFPDYQKLEEMGQAQALPHTKGGGKRIKELDALDVLPREPAVNEWTRVSSHAIRRHRRLSVDDLAKAVENATLVEAPLLHPHAPPPSPSELRKGRSWDGAVLPTPSKHTGEWQRPTTAPREDYEADCGAPALALITSCLNTQAPKARGACMSELRSKGRRCPELAGLVARSLLSEQCAGERAKECGGLLSAHAALAEKEQPDVLAAFLSATSAVHLPAETPMFLGSIEKPTEAFMRALVHLLRSASADGISQWYLVTLLMPAAGAVYNVRHGKSAPRANPIELTGPMGDLVDEIVATIAAALESVRAVDATAFAPHHDAAEAAAALAWSHKFSEHEREAIVAEHAQIVSHEGIRFEREAATYGELERASMTKLKHELIQRRDGYDREAEAEHELLYAFLLRSFGNLGLPPSRVGGEALIINASACLDHRSEIVREAAVASLRRSPHPKAEAALRAQLGKPHTKPHWKQRRAALQALADWEHVSAETIERAVDELITFPLRTDDECHQRCRATRNPHLLHVAHHKATCKDQCKHERAHAQALHKLLRRHDEAGVHDMPSVIRTRVEVMLERAAEAILAAEREAQGADGVDNLEHLRRWVNESSTKSRRLQAADDVVLLPAVEYNGATMCPPGSCTQMLTANFNDQLQDGTPGVQGCSGQIYSYFAVNDNPQQGQEVCEQCVAGKYQTQLAATTCVDCTDDQVCTEAGLTTTPAAASGNSNALAAGNFAIAAGIGLASGIASGSCPPSPPGAPACSKKQLAKNAAKKMAKGLLKKAAGAAAMNVCASVSDCDNIEGSLWDAVDLQGAAMDTISASQTSIRRRRLASRRRLAMSKDTCLNIQALCQGIDIILGHSPIEKGAKYGGPKLPLIGEVGLEWSLVIANSLWARLGIFDGGFGVDVEDTFTVEFYAGPIRHEILKIGIELKFDFTYCTICELSVGERQADSGSGYIQLAQSAIEGGASVAGVSSAFQGAGRGRRLTQSQDAFGDSSEEDFGRAVVNAREPTLWEALKDFYNSVEDLGLPQLWSRLGDDAADLTSPADPGSFLHPLRKLMDFDTELATALAAIFEAAAAAHPIAHPLDPPTTVLKEDVRGANSSLNAWTSRIEEASDAFDVAGSPFAVQVRDPLPRTALLPSPVELGIERMPFCSPSHACCAASLHGHRPWTTPSVRWPSLSSPWTGWSIASLRTRPLSVRRGCGRRCGLARTSLPSLRPWRTTRSNQAACLCPRNERSGCIASWASARRRPPRRPGIGNRPIFSSSAPI